MNIAPDHKISNTQNLEGRIITLESDYKHINWRLNKIDKAIEDISADVKDIIEKISQQIGASNAKKTGWKVAGYVITVLVTLGAHHAILKYWNIHL